MIKLLGGSHGYESIWNWRKIALLANEGYVVVDHKNHQITLNWLYIFTVHQIFHQRHI